jgi:hypothetical protein
MNEFVKYLVYFYLISSVFMFFFNFVFMKMWFIWKLKCDYPSIWESIGRPKFFQMSENIDDILDIRGDLEKNHPLMKMLSLYGFANKILNYIIVSGAILSVFYWLFNWIENV